MQVWRPALCCMKRQEREDKFQFPDFQFPIFNRTDYQSPLARVFKLAIGNWQLEIPL